MRLIMVIVAVYVLILVAQSWLDWNLEGASVAFGCSRPSDDSLLLSIKLSPLTAVQPVPTDRPRQAAEAWRDPLEPPAPDHAR